MSSNKNPYTRKSFPQRIPGSGRRAFLRQPGHALESRWALYVDTAQLESLINANRQLPVIRIVDTAMLWTPELETEDDKKLRQVKRGAYCIYFTIEIMVGESEFHYWKFTSEDKYMDGFERMLGFRHEAPAPILPWPGCVAREIDMPYALICAVNKGLQQAQEALVLSLEPRNPVVTALIA